MNRDVLTRLGQAAARSTVKEANAFTGAGKAIMRTLGLGGKAPAHAPVAKFAPPAPTAAALPVAKPMGPAFSGKSFFPEAKPATSFNLGPEHEVASAMARRPGPAADLAHQSNRRALDAATADMRMPSIAERRLNAGGIGIGEAPAVSRPQNLVDAIPTPARASPTPARAKPGFFAGMFNRGRPSPADTGTGIGRAALKGTLIGGGLGTAYAGGSQLVDKMREGVPDNALDAYEHHQSRLNQMMSPLDQQIEAQKKLLADRAYGPSFLRNPIDTIFGHDPAKYRGQAQGELDRLQGMRDRGEGGQWGGFFDSASGRQGKMRDSANAAKAEYDKLVGGSSRQGVESEAADLKRRLASGDYGRRVGGVFGGPSESQLAGEMQTKLKGLEDRLKANQFGAQDPAAVAMRQRMERLGLMAKEQPKPAVPPGELKGMNPYQAYNG